MGRKPVTIENISLNLINEYEEEEILNHKITSEIKAINFIEEFPITLLEGSFHRFHMHEKFINQNFNGIEVITTDGRRYELKSKEIKMLKANAEINNLPEENKMEYYLRGSKSKRVFRFFSFLRKA